MELRHTIFAHSDSKHYDLITSQTNDGASIDVLTGIWPRITAKEAALLEKMIRGLIAAIDSKVEEIRPDTYFVRAPF
jgi:hypothetical protein